MSKKQENASRVWMMCAVVLLALFFLKTTGMIFQGAITGLGMFVAVSIFMYYIPGLKNLLFHMGGIFDLAVSFGLPYVLTCVMGIKGGTMLIATITCGLLFSFSLATRRMGGVVPSVKTSIWTLIDGAKEQIQLLKENNESSLLRGPGSPGSPHSRSRREQPSQGEEDQDHGGSRRLGPSEYKIG
jgi:hypothetical protein